MKPVMMDSYKEQKTNENESTFPLVFSLTALTYEVLHNYCKNAVL